MTITNTAGFEPASAEHNGLAVHLLNHSDTLSFYAPSRDRTCDFQLIRLAL